MEDKKDKDLNIKIETTQGSWDTAFSKTAKVQDVIESVKTHFNFAPQGNYALKEVNSNSTLKPERPLVSYGIKDGDILVFTDLGVAVCQ